jgi:hypothetical protein
LGASETIVESLWVVAEKLSGEKLRGKEVSDLTHLFYMEGKMTLLRDRR